ncbi:uncharacterized protein PV07_03541 [Cladophialophora immunda]|uniref:Uncharacterized protein n=1 Tax=Cladophialophora immunda TaxID=569365 RepID=A0A0D2CPP1_9EURO|nr:uncharacterized protein PV07_03541 [Cladophialophora immunda]KIW31955.1 hypothetical protein PV07_03541 [Cladophialophora immunda]OQU96646.1 hypothetical protein CLAIMM_02696 [Cladophialophora immunda]
MDVFTRLASGIYMRQHHRGDDRSQPLDPARRRAKRLQDLQDDELHRAIAHTNDHIAEAKTKYESLRKRRQAIRAKLDELSAEMYGQDEKIMQLQECRGECLKEKKAREERRGELRREQRGRAHGKESPRRGW